MRDKGEPLLIKGTLIAKNGALAVGAKLYIWHSDPGGFYSGYDSDFPVEYCRGVVRLDDTGGYAIQTTMPVPYTIALGGIANKLLTDMGRHPLEDSACPLLSAP